MANNTTHPELWDENTVIEDKDGKRYSWSLPHGYRGSQHLTTWGRKLLCGQQAGYGTFEHPFGSERACKVCIRIAEKLVREREVALAQPVSIDFTREELDTLHALINRARDSYHNDIDRWESTGASQAAAGQDPEVAFLNRDYSSRMFGEAETLLARVTLAKIPGALRMDLTPSASTEN